MMSDFANDEEISTDKTLNTLEDICNKYIIDQTHLETYKGIMAMMGPMFFQVAVEGSNARGFDPHATCACLSPA